jgi:hypothetical protein
MCNTLSTNYPNTVVIFITPINRTNVASLENMNYFNSIRNAIYEKATENGYYVINGADLGFPSKQGAYQQAMIYDNLHPTVQGHKMYADAVSGILLGDYNNLAPIIGEYLPTTANGTVKKYSAAIGATTATFNASGFMAKYGLSSTDLVFDVSAETANGQVVAYNSVTVNSSGVVTVTFDALSEATTFICKCSTI